MNTIYEDFDSILYVKGNITITTSYFNCPFIIGYCDVNIEKYATKIEYGDIIIDDKYCKNLSSYTLIAAKGDIISFSSSTFKWPDTITSCFSVFDKSIRELCKILDLSNTNIELEYPICKLVYIGAVSAYESYIMDILQCFFAYNPKNYIKMFINNEKCGILDEFCQEYYVRQKIRELYCSKTDKIKVKFSQLLNIDVPDMSFLNDIYNTRNDLVHRNGYNKESGDKVDLSKNKVLADIEQIKSFVDELNTLCLSVEQYYIRNFI